MSERLSEARIEEICSEAFLNACNHEAWDAEYALLQLRDDLAATRRLLEQAESHEAE